MSLIEGELVVVRHRNRKGDTLTLSKVVKVFAANPKPVVLVDCEHDKRCGHVHLTAQDNVSRERLWEIE